MTVESELLVGFVSVAWEDSGDEKRELVESWDVGVGVGMGMGMGVLQSGGIAG